MKCCDWSTLLLRIILKQVWLVTCQVAPEKTGRHANEYETIPAADPNVYANYVDCQDQLDSYTNVSDKQALKSDF